MKSERRGRPEPEGAAWGGASTHSELSEVSRSFFPFEELTIRTVDSRPRASPHLS